MLARIVILTAAVWMPLLAQQVCAPTPTYSPCEIAFELNDQEAAAHPDPYATADIRAELRSPRARTILMTAFWDGGKRMVIRFTPTDPGQWDFRITSNIERFNGKLGQVQATESTDPGFLAPANVHHWRHTESLLAHLWMGDTYLDFASAPDAQFNAYLEARAQQKFTHIRGLLLPTDAKRAFTAGGQPDPAWFQQVDKRIAAINQKGLFTDLILAPNGSQFDRAVNGWQARDRFLRYVTSRYAAYHLTWQLFGEYESHAGSRALLKEIGGLLIKYDPYKHPRSTGTLASSAPLSSDAWMNFVVHHSTDNAVGAIEHQLFPAPFVNTGVSAGGVSPEDFARRLWSASLNGQYPTAILDTSNPDSAQARIMKGWQEFFARTRYWELEPYFDVDGARSLALPGVEYIMYVEKGGYVELLIEKHSYDIYWFNPVTGELTKEKKDYKGEKYATEPPNKTQDWVLHLSRDGRKEGMLRSYKFESRPNLLQEIEQNPAKMPFDFLAPTAEQLSISKPAQFNLKIKRETRGTRAMMYLWTGEVPTEGAGYRVIGTGATGTLQIPANLAKLFPAVFNMRIYALNAVGKVYAVDKVFRLTE